MFLGIDIGTGGSRAVVIDVSGRVIAAATAEHAPFASPMIGWAEQDPDNWWRAACAAIHAVLSTDGVSADEISSIGLSGQMHGSVLLDESDRVIRPALIWCDQRTQKQCDDINAKVGREKVIELVANPAITGFTLPKLLWVRENEPEAWANVRKALLPKDYVRLRLSGDSASDVADASGTLLLDVRNREWSAEMLEAFEIDRILLPDAFESIEVTGTVSASGAAETGLRGGTPIVAGAGDNAGGAIGMGITAPGMASVTIGTSGVVFAATDKPRLDADGRIHTLCHAIPGRWHNTGVTQSAGLSLRWFRDTFSAGSSYDDITSAASQIPPGSDGAIWLPYLMGERSPHMDPNARGAFVGLTASHTKAHLARAVLEGVAFSLRESLEIFEQLGTPIESVRVGGGGSRSPLWRQIQADVFGKPLEVIQADEGAAFGAAILAGVGVGAWDSVDAACNNCIRVAATVEPNRTTAEVIDRNYQAYKTLYAGLQPAINIATGHDQYE